MTPRDFILYRTHTLHIAAAGMAALVMCFVVWAATQAEQEFKRQDLAMQESHATW